MKLCNVFACDEDDPIQSSRLAETVLQLIDACLIGLYTTKSGADVRTAILHRLRDFGQAAHKCNHDVVGLFVQEDHPFFTAL